MASPHNSFISNGSSLTKSSEVWNLDLVEDSLVSRLGQLDVADNGNGFLNEDHIRQFESKLDKLHEERIPKPVAASTATNECIEISAPDNCNNHNNVTIEKIYENTKIPKRPPSMKDHRMRVLDNNFEPEGNSQPCPRNSRKIRFDSSGKPDFPAKSVSQSSSHAPSAIDAKPFNYNSENYSNSLAKNNEPLKDSCLEKKREEKDKFADRNASQMNLLISPISPVTNVPEFSLVTSNKVINDSHEDKSQSFSTFLEAALEATEKLGKGESSVDENQQLYSTIDMPKARRDSSLSSRIASGDRKKKGRRRRKGMKWRTALSLPVAIPARMACNCRHGFAPIKPRIPLPSPQPEPEPVELFLLKGWVCLRHYYDYVHLWS